MVGRKHSRLAIFDKDGNEYPSQTTPPQPTLAGGRHGYHADLIVIDEVQAFKDDDLK